MRSGEFNMARNFNMIINKKSDNLHLKLFGDFDGTSAWELLNTVKENNHSPKKVFIHTSGLCTVYPFGVAVFRKNLKAIFGKSMLLILIGDKAKELDPEI